MSELFSGTREVGYYGESQSFSIGTQTNNLSLAIALIQVPGTGTDTEGGTDTLLDTTAPTASVTTATITTSGSAVVQSTETGTAYLVKTTVSVSNNFTSITGAGPSQWNSVPISLANTDTNLPATGLADGTYKVYAVDAAYNLSSASSNSVTVVTDTTAPTVSFSPANGATGVAISDNITITFSEAVRNIDNTVLTNSNSGDANGVGSLITLRLNNTYGTNIAFYATIDTNKTVITIDPTNNLPQSQAVYVAIGSTVEDAAENSITAANATFTTTMDPSLEAFYPFNGNANDLTSNGRNLADYGETTLIAGKDNSSNSAYYFDGDEDYLEYTGIIPSFDSYTISLWAKPSSSGTYEAMFSSYDDPDKGFQIDLDDVGNFHIRKAGASGGNIVLSAAQLEVWTFIAFTYDGTNSIGYINDNITVSDPGGTTEFNRFRIGKNRNGGTHFTGAIDELRIYNRALTASEISSLYANMRTESY